MCLKTCQVSEDEPIPFYIDLAGWDGHSDRFEQWCTRCVSSTYGIPETYVKVWFDDSDLALMLDGLDELLRKERSACISAINRFRQTRGLINVVVTSRTEDYVNSSRQLLLRGCLSLEPLEIEVLVSELDRIDPEGDSLLAKVRRDSRLRDLLRTPLFLNLAVNAYCGKSPEVMATKQKSWRATIIDAYLSEAEKRIAMRGKNFDLGLQSWLPQVIRNMKAEHRNTIYPDFLPLYQLDDSLKPAIMRRTALLGAALTASIILVIRLPVLFFLRDDKAFIGFVLGSVMVVPAACVMSWNFCKRALDRPATSRLQINKTKLIRVGLIWSILYSSVGSIATTFSHLGKSPVIQLAFVCIASGVGIYPAIGFARSVKESGQISPRYPGDGVRSLVTASFSCTAVTGAAIFLSLFMTESPIMYGSGILSMAGTVSIVPYFAAPVLLGAWLRTGGASLLCILAARRIQGEHGRLPEKYMASFRALQRSSILVLNGGGYGVVHSLVRDHLAARGVQSVRRATRRRTTTTTTTTRRRTTTRIGNR